MFKLFEQATKDMTKVAADFARVYSEFYISIPKTPEEMKAGYERLKTVLEEEGEKNVAMWRAYQKSMIGQSTQGDIDAANRQAQDCLKAAGMATLIAVPGTLFFLPFIVNSAKEKGIDIVPESFKKVLAASKPNI